MLITRALANQILSLATRKPHQRLLALLKGETLDFIDDPQQLQSRLQQTPDCVVIYNQNDENLDLMDALPAGEGQGYIEVFQEIEGVFGLRASVIKGGIDTPEPLNFNNENQHV